MAHSDGLSQWTDVVSTHLPALTAPQAHVLAAYSYGMVMTGQCGQTLISDYLAVLEYEDEANVRQRLREWCYDAADKCGAQRQQLLVTHCFAPLVRWVLDWWQSPQHCLVLVCDATTLRQTFTVLSISLVYRACALPVAWQIVPALTAGSWRAHWLDLLARLASAIPADWQVLVLTDRGLYAKWLYLQVLSHGWHPLMRINLQGQVRLASRATWQPLAPSASAAFAHGGRNSTAPCSPAGRPTPGSRGCCSPTCPPRRHTPVGIACAVGSKAASRTTSAAVGAGNRRK